MKVNFAMLLENPALELVPENENDVVRLKYLLRQMEETVCPMVIQNDYARAFFILCPNGSTMKPLKINVE